MSLCNLSVIFSTDSDTDVVFSASIPVISSIFTSKTTEEMNKQIHWLWLPSGVLDISSYKTTSTFKYTLPIVVSTCIRGVIFSEN